MHDDSFMMYDLAGVFLTEGKETNSRRNKKNVSDLKKGKGKYSDPRQNSDSSRNVLLLTSTSSFNVSCQCIYILITSFGPLDDTDVELHRLVE